MSRGILEVLRIFVEKVKDGLMGAQIHQELREALRAGIDLVQALTKLKTKGMWDWGLGTTCDPLLPPGDQCSGGPIVGRLSLPQAGGAGLGWGSAAGV